MLGCLRLFTTHSHFLSIQIQLVLEESWKNLEDLGQKAMIWATLLLHLALMCSGDATRVGEDTATGLPEDKWFYASDHLEELQSFVAAWRGARDLDCLDVFSVSGSIARMWSKHGLKSEQYDIQLDHRGHDVVGKRGFLHLLRLGLRCREGALVMGGPPCSLNIFLLLGICFQRFSIPFYFLS